MALRRTRFEDLRPGQRASVTKTVTEADLERFIAITGDTNPLHTDEAFAAATRFGGRIVHGMLTASLLSTLVGMHIPGTGAVYRSQRMAFLRPVRIGDTLTAWIEVIAADPARNRVRLATWIENQHGERVLEGEAEAGLLR
ncbi:MaoC family dehydratase [Inmirania thermothiophila]|uniref:3-hydroxybutyryl-CoA dehydratase n=1 Tax=Inmirania thermothiophila TaxID=1750597 RepID=A0A3N1Y8B2_9GAMM|nr:MaoC family dehydratase [Inmirania thermothiophila]ROR35043.1 3-hydroxybutyryl-CoA dehydratase [Inmirania thermothiophila]